MLTRSETPAQALANLERRVRFVLTGLLSGSPVS